MPPPVPKEIPNYDARIDFKKLVELDGEFKKLLVANGGVMDWKDERHVLQLTKCLLKRDFGLSLEMPNDRLCPPVPGRYSYIRWIQALVDSTSESFSEGYSPNRQVLGIDIGIGSSCIYPLLGAVLRPNWRFYGTEIDEKNFAFASRNVQNNDLTSRIRLLQTSSTGPILPLDKLAVEHADFTMCNPPFYSSKPDMLTTWNKNTPPSAVCTGAEVEMITEGGDAGFVVRIVNESKQLGEQVQWYTSMLGKLSSVTVVVARLKELGCKNWAVGCLLTGGKTRRWVVGWSWGDLRPRNDVARCEVPTKDILPFPTEYTIPAHSRDKEALAAKLNGILKELEIHWQWRPSIWSGMAVAKENTWSRSARRKKQREAQKSLNVNDKMEIDGEHNDSSGDESMQDEPQLIVKINIGEDKIVVRWLKGMDALLFESFCGMLKRILLTGP